MRRRCGARCVRVEGAGHILPITITSIHHLHFRWGSCGGGWLQHPGRIYWRRSLRVQSMMNRVKHPGDGATIHVRVPQQRSIECEDKGVASTHLEWVHWDGGARAGALACRTRHLPRWPCTKHKRHTTGILGLEGKRALRHQH